MSTETNVKRFRVAFSFAGEKRAFVEATAGILAERFGEERVLYDKFHEAEFARYNLGTYLPKLYGEQSELIVPVLCPDYDQKRWTGWEWVHIFGLLTKADGYRVMPSRFDHANAEGMSEAAGFIELDDKTPEQFATLILQRLAINEGEPKNHYGKPDGSNTNTGSEHQMPNTVDAHHKTFAMKSLQAATSFFKALQGDFRAEFPSEPVPASAAEMADYFAGCAPERVEDLFYMVRRALKDMQADDSSDSARFQTSEAASAMYCMAAIRLIDRAAHEQGSHIVNVPRNEHVICAVISAALFGGQLRLQLNEQSPLPRPEFAFEIKNPASGDHLQAGLERALYTELFENGKKAGSEALNSEALNADENNALIVRLRSIRKVHKGSLTLIISGHADLESSASIAAKYRIPVMFPTGDVSSSLLAMDAGELLAHIKEFWEELNDYYLGDPEKPSTEKGENMAKSGININAPSGTVVFSTGSNSAAQSGSGNSYVGRQQAADITPLLTLLVELQTEIRDLSSAKDRTSLGSHLQTAQTEVAKNKPDAGLLKQSLEAIKLGGDAVDGGEKIVELCARALPLLSLLPSFL